MAKLLGIVITAIGLLIIGIGGDLRLGLIISILGLLIIATYRR